MWFECFNSLLLTWHVFVIFLSNFVRKKRRFASFLDLVLIGLNYSKCWAQSPCHSTIFNFLESNTLYSQGNIISMQVVMSTFPQKLIHRYKYRIKLGPARKPVRSHSFDVSISYLYHLIRHKNRLITSI